MSWYNKVVWSEGLFLRPQLFQQQERYLEYYAHKRSATLSPFFWGFTALEIDTDALSLGKLILRRASGIFQDGTPFDAPGFTGLPLPLTVMREHLEQRIFLAVSVRMPSSEETAFAEAGTSAARYDVFDTEVRDSNSNGKGPQPVQLGNLRVRLMPEKEMTNEWLGLPVTQILELGIDGSVRLNSGFVPPVAIYGASSLIRTWMAEVCDLVELRATALAGRLAGYDNRAGQVTEVTDYLLLQLLNRYGPILGHLRKVVETPPVELYRLFITLAAEMSTYVRISTRRPAQLPDYLHLSPRESLEQVVDDLRSLLNTVLDRGAQLLRLEQRPHGLYVANISPLELKAFGVLVLGVSAAMAPDTLVQQFLAKAKLAPSERLSELIRGHLPGIPLQSLPMAPRQVPFHADFVYFELRQQGVLWEQIVRTGGISLHVAGEFSELKLELWGIREK